MKTCKFSVYKTNANQIANRHWLNDLSYNVINIEFGAVQYSFSAAWNISYRNVIADSDIRERVIYLNIVVKTFKIKQVS